MNKEYKKGQKNILINFRGLMGNPHKTKKECLKDWEEFVENKLKELENVPFD